MKLLNLKRSAALIGLITLSACGPPEPKPAGDPLVAKGRELFFKEEHRGLSG